MSSSSTSGSPTPSATKPKWTARMGSALRRSSTILTPSRPGTPSEEKDAPAVASSSNDTGKHLRRSSSKGSLRSIKIPFSRGKTESTTETRSSSPPPPVRRSTSRGSLRSIKNAFSRPKHAITSSEDIAESPMREAAAVQNEIVGPSPLAQAESGTQTDASSVEANDAVVGESTEATPAPVEEVAPSPEVQVPAEPSVAGKPDASIDDFVQVDHPNTVVDPISASSPVPAQEAPPVVQIVEAPTQVKDGIPSTTNEAPAPKSEEPKIVEDLPVQDTVVSEPVEIVAQEVSAAVEPVVVPEALREEPTPVVAVAPEAQPELPVSTPITTFTDAAKTATPAENLEVVPPPNIIVSPSSPHDIEAAHTDSSKALAAKRTPEENASGQSTQSIIAHTAWNVTVFGVFGVIVPIITGSYFLFKRIVGSRRQQ
ncbi:hypothetical protein CPB83DRAFT_863744 [Crepidotus variabilis]|uniref:Uncharacterized protein n=1 Tax=Crepidotus variabilis TaxID=179855 RepID=A0A9P6E5P7_9AGAR|nr:hypothetical protein CPB83DRAFT_863744 [Crepidotus variabilis]